MARIMTPQQREIEARRAEQERRKQAMMQRKRFNPMQAIIPVGAYKLGSEIVGNVADAGESLYNMGSDVVGGVVDAGQRVIGGAADAIGAGGYYDQASRGVSALGDMIMGADAVSSAPAAAGMYGGAAASTPGYSIGGMSTMGGESIGGMSVPAGVDVGTDVVSGATAATPTPSTPWISSSPLDLAGGALGAYGMYNLINQNTRTRNPQSVGMSMAQGAAAGAAIGNAVPVIGTAAGAIIGGVVGAIRGLWKSGKHSHQMRRDAVRNGLRNLNFVQTIDGSDHLTLADGSTYNIGLDGQNTLQSASGTNYRPYNTDPDNPLGHQAVGWARPLAIILTGAEDQKLIDDFTGYISNAAMSNAETLEGVRANILGFMEQLGLDAASATTLLDELRNQGKISAEEYEAAIYGLGVMIEGREEAYQYGSTAEHGTPYDESVNPGMGTTSGAPEEAAPVPTPEQAAATPGTEGYDASRQPAQQDEPVKAGFGSVAPGHWAYDMVRQQQAGA